MIFEEHQNHGVVASGQLDGLVNGAGSVQAVIILQQKIGAV